MCALHDVSKHDDMRLDPKANASDARAQRDATNTTSIHPVTDATTTRGFLQTGSGRILANDGSNNVGLFGFDSTGTMVVKVAKSGFDANSASNANLVFNSSQNVFKILDTNTGVLPAIAAATAGTPATNSLIVTTTIPGTAAPYMALAYVNVSAAPLDAYQLPLFVAISQLAGGFGGYIHHKWDVNTTTTTGDTSGFVQLIFNGTNFSNAIVGALNVRWYILQETAQA